MRIRLVVLAVLLMIGAAANINPVYAGEDTVNEDLPPPPPPPPPPPVDDPLPPPADDPIPEAEPAEDEGETRSGVISGGRVNIRSGPSTRYEIVVTLNNGAAVTVHAQKNGWYKIGYPTTQKCYIHQQFLNDRIPPNIPARGLKMKVKAEKAQLRVRPWDKSTVVGQVGKNAHVVVIGKRAEWAQINAHPAARAFVFGKYVTVKGDVSVDPETAPENPDLPETKATVPEAVKKKSDLEKQALERKEKFFVDLRRREENQKRQRQEDVDNILATLEKELAGIEEETRVSQEMIVSESKSAQPEKDKFLNEGFTGWVEYIGRVGRRPAAFRLNKGGEIIFMLRSAKFDLAKYVNRRVVVDGDVELAPGFEANVLVVDSIRQLTEPPAAVRDQKVNIRYPYVSPKNPVVPVREKSLPEEQKKPDTAGEPEEAVEKVIEPTEEEDGPVVREVSPPTRNAIEKKDLEGAAKETIK